MRKWLAPRFDAGACTMLKSIKFLIMEMYGKNICVSCRELVESGIISKPTYDKYVNQGKLTVARRGARNREALVYYDTMYPPVRVAYDTKNPEAKEHLQEQLRKRQSFPMNIRLKSDDKAVEFYKTYIPKISIERQKEYVLNAKVMNAMIVQETGLRNKHSEHGYTHKRLVRNTVISLCEELRRSFNHTLPKSESRLMEKFEDYKKRSYVALVSGTTGNQSARKIGPREGRILLRLRRSKFPVYTDMQIFDEFNRIVTERNARATREEDKLKPVESPQTVINYLYKTGIKLWWYGVVHGEIAFKNEFMPQFDTKLPQMPNTLWYGDGTKLNLYYKDYDKKNKRMVARTIDVYEVMDACSEVFLGYSFGAENFLTQYEAYRMALDHPEAVNKLVLLDIVSTYDMYSLSTREFAKALFQWYFFTQEAPLPEDMILSSRKQFFRYSLHIARYHSENDTSAEAFPQDVYDEYLRHYNVETIHAICEEYRAGETVDLALDEEDLRAGRKIRAETLVLWGANGLVERFFRPLECWAKFGDHIQGHNLPCGHFIPEEAPLPMLEAVENFL